MEKSTTDLKYLWILKNIVVWFLVVLSNVYDFAKENSGDFKTKVVSLENTLVSDFGPAYEKLKELAEQILVFLDDKFDKYAPSLAKKVFAEFEFQIYKIKPFVEIIITTSQIIIIPLISTTIFLLQTTKYLMLNIITTTATNTTTKSTLLISKTQNHLQKGLTTTQTHFPSSPLAATTQAFLQDSLDATKSLVSNTILQKGLDLTNQARDTTMSLVEDVPLVGNVAQTLVSNPTDIANQIVNIPNSLINKNPILEAINSTTQNNLDTTKSVVPDTILQKSLELANQAQDSTKSLVEGIPLVGNVAQSLVSNPIDVANQIVNTPISLVNENPILKVVNSTTQKSLDTTKSLVPETILQKGPDLANQAQDTTKSLVEGIPLVGNVAKSLVSNPTDIANQIVNTPNSSANENPILDAVNSTAKKSLDTTISVVPNTIFQQAQDTTKSLFGSIPLLGNVEESLVTNPTDLANTIVNTTNSLVNENPLLEVVNSVAKSSLDTDESQVQDAILQNGIDLTNQAIGTTKSLVGGVPLMETVSQSLITNPADLSKSLVPNTILQKDLDSVNQTLDTTKSLVGSIPLMGDVAYSLTNKPTDLTNQIVSTTNSLVNENPALEAFNSAAQNIVKDVQSIGTKSNKKSGWLNF